MLSKKMEEALNAQINAEMWSAYFYLSMSAWCAAAGKPGMAHWFEVQFREEQDHARIFFNYVLQRGGRAELDVFESTLAHEEKVTALINNLFALTTAENDYATQSMLKWFIDEQVEEEDNVRNILDNLRMLNGNGYGLFMVDKELAARTYTPASPLGAEA